MTTRQPFDAKHKSRTITQGPERAPARAMLRAVGLDDDALARPFVGVANLGSEVTPCNFHLGRLAAKVKDGVRSARGTPFEFGTITVSDGISMGTDGMKTSLVSREVIADSIELVARGEWFDGLVTVAGCDKNMPGCMMAIARLNIPAVFVYGGSILPGVWRGKDINIQDV
ncbi:MAG: dihydroxy-acid dehydratase, partial [Chloroflexi bacterium]|nr:dihydroxy-acid dehydratase [Chloroflexota bacterium]